MGMDFILDTNTIELEARLAAQPTPMPKFALAALAKSTYAVWHGAAPGA